MKAVCVFCLCLLYFGQIKSQDTDIKSSNALLSSITWSDIPEDYRDLFGRIQNTIPNFFNSVYRYKVQVPSDVDGIPALIAKTEDVNAKVGVDRAVSLYGTDADKIITFTSTDEDDTTVLVYQVQPEKQQNTADIQLWQAEPFISEFIFWEQWSNSFVEICNPGTLPLDLSNYMFFGQWCTDPKEAITQYAGPDDWMNRYVKYVPGYKWEDSATWRITPARLVQDTAVNPIVQPGDVFVMSGIWSTIYVYGEGGYGDGNWPAETQAAVIFNHPTKGNTWNEPVGETCVRQWTGTDFYIYKILNDSVKNGTKPANDPNDFELIETFGHADGSSWKPAGEAIGMITTCIRKPEFYLPKPGFAESFGNTEESSEWIMMDQAFFNALGFEWPMDLLMVCQDLGQHSITYKSTVTSTIYKVSQGYSMYEEIRGVMTGTLITDFLGNIIKADAGQRLMLIRGTDTLTGNDVLMDGDALVVTSADLLNTTKYFLDVWEPINIQADYSSVICPSSMNGYIKLSVSGGSLPYTYSWSSGQVSKDISELFAGEYIFNITDSNDCQKVDTFTISEAVPYGGEEICIVSADQQTGNNLIIWEKTPNEGTDYYKIYRESNIIGTVDFSDLSVFEDTVADPETRPYLYYLSVVDTCGNESELSPYHKPLFLQYVSSEQGVNLTWDEYEVEEGQMNFVSYTLFRGTDSIALSPLEEDIPVQINVYTDNDPAVSEQKYYYRIAGVLVNACEPIGSKKSMTETFSYAMSNLTENRISETRISTNLNNQFNIYPNPFAIMTTLIFPNPNHSSYQLILTDIRGKIFKTQTDITDSQFILNCSDIPSGLYFVELKGPNIYRSKIIIEK